MGKRHHFILFVMTFIIVILVGSYLYQNIEGWSYLDSLYFVVVTTTTIGYGDLAPLTDVGKIFTIFFSFFGIAMVFYFISVIGSYIFEKQLLQLNIPMDSKIRPKFEINKKKKHREKRRR